MNITLLQHLGWGLFHSLWIITVLAAVYGFVSLFVPRHLRYCVGYAVLLTMLILPAITCFLFDPINIAPQRDETRRLRFASPPDKLVLDAPYNVHKKVEKILASME